MSLFEYLSIAFSLILSFSVIRILGGLPHALDKKRRYWVHLTIAALLVLCVIGCFWALWSYRDVVWTFPKFFLVMAMLGTLYFLCATLIPENPAEVKSWHDFYYSIRIRYFAGACLFVIAVAASRIVILDMPWNHPDQVLLLIFFFLGILGLSTANPRAHAIVISLYLMSITYMVTIILFQPGSLAQ